MHPARSVAILPDPPQELKQLSRQLTERVLERIRRSGPMPFAQFMEMALYEPGLGYYSSGLPKFGAEGDFVTAPELGDLFARCLAAQAAEVADELGRWDILEVGAGSGRLAAGLLASLPPGQLPRRYRILERSGELRDRQRRHMETAAGGNLDRVEWLDEPPTRQWQGLLLANEVIDALPVERFHVGDGGVSQLCVAADGSGFRFALQPDCPRLQDLVSRTLGKRLDSLPHGYTSEICPALPDWLGGLTQSLSKGVALVVDYGYPRSEYYLPERRDGTLVCHYRHRAHDDPFVWPGLQDITSFVDFTAVAEAAQSSGLDCLGYASQAMFLIGCGLRELAAGLEDLTDRQRLEAAAEIRMLALPGMMGERFQCMALGRNYGRSLRGFSEQDLRGRL